MNKNSLVNRINQLIYKIRVLPVNVSSAKIRKLYKINK